MLLNRPGMASKFVSYARRRPGVRPPPPPAVGERCWIEADEKADDKLPFVLGAELPPSGGFPLPAPHAARPCPPTCHTYPPHATPTHLIPHLPTSFTPTHPIYTYPPYLHLPTPHLHLPTSFTPAHIIHTYPPHATPSHPMPHPPTPCHTVPPHATPSHRINTSGELTAMKTNLTCAPVASHAVPSNTFMLVVRRTNNPVSAQTQCAHRSAHTTGLRARRSASPPPLAPPRPTASESH